MSDDGSITYASECAETESEEEDYGGEDEEVVAHQEEPEVCHKSEDLQKVVDFLAIRLRHARTLLIHHRWNVESLFGKLAETGTNEIFLEAGLPPPEDLCSRPQICEPSFISCGICLDDAPQKEATRMDCGHAFCNDCKHTCSLDSTTIVSVHHQCLIELCFNLLS
jgi:ariadne-1